MFMFVTDRVENHEFTNHAHHQGLLLSSTVYHHRQALLSQSLAFEQLPLCLTALIGQRAWLLLSSQPSSTTRRRQVKTCQSRLLHTTSVQSHKQQQSHTATSTGVRTVIRTANLRQINGLHQKILIGKKLSIFGQDVPFQSQNQSFLTSPPPQSHRIVSSRT